MYEVHSPRNLRSHQGTSPTCSCRHCYCTTRGAIYVFDVVTVIPEPSKPDTNKKLKLIAKEEIPRGAVTAVSEVGMQGLMLVAQGQKCMVRGLKEDGSLLPVAFMDMNTYVSSIRELPGSGLCVMADLHKGIWFTGCTEEPYKMQMFRM